jgi:hypothetical protein
VAQKGVFLAVFGPKTEINFLSIFQHILSIKFTNYFFRIPRKISALMDQQFSKCGHFKQLKKGYSWTFLGLKTENQLSRFIMRAEFHQKKLS